jgi:hypothetical protein
MPVANRATERPAHFQFTLRAAMIAVGVVCVVFGFTAWKGVPGAIGSLLVADLGILTFAAWTRRRRLVVGSGIGLLVPLVLVALYFFGPWSEVYLACIVCGKDKRIERFFEITVSEEEQETELSQWYREAEMRPHAHQWAHVCATLQHWGGGLTAVDSLGGRLYPLHLLMRVSQSADRSTFENLVEDYYATRENPATIPSFIDRCGEIVRSDDSATADP